jgi:hypothetical protein
MVNDFQNRNSIAQKKQPELTNKIASNLKASTQQKKQQSEERGKI